MDDNDCECETFCGLSTGLVMPCVNVALPPWMRLKLKDAKDLLANQKSGTVLEEMGWNRKDAHFRLGGPTDPSHFTPTDVFNVLESTLGAGNFVLSVASVKELVTSIGQLSDGSGACYIIQGVANRKRRNPNGMTPGCPWVPEDIKYLHGRGKQIWKKMTIATGTPLQ